MKSMQEIDHETMRVSGSIETSVSTWKHVGDNVLHANGRRRESKHVDCKVVDGFFAQPHSAATLCCHTLLPHSAVLKIVSRIRTHHLPIAQCHANKN